MEQDGSLVRVGEYRRAARLILRDGMLDDAGRTEALVRLQRRAWAEEDAQFTIGAILAELMWDIDSYYVNGETAVGEPIVRRHRNLRNQGYENCPECWSPLSTEVDWGHWRRLRQDAIREAEAREGAVSDVE
jgi:hypothetical protein